MDELKCLINRSSIEKAKSFSCLSLFTNENMYKCKSPDIARYNFYTTQGTRHGI